MQGAERAMSVRPLHHYLPALAGWVVLACARTESGAPPAGPAAVHAFDAPGFHWRVIALPDRGARLYLQRQTAADEDARAAADSVRRARDDVLALLEEPPASSEEAALFFLGSRAEMQRLTGRPLAGFVQPGEATAFFVWARGYRAPLRHELAHLYTFERWGRPAAGDSATWLVEGIGAWVGGPCQGHSADALAAGLLSRGALPSVADLAGRFRALPEDVALPAAGSLTHFLHLREGVAGLRARWRSGPAAVLPDSEMEAAWRAQLASVPPAWLDIARVMQEGC